MRAPVFFMRSLRLILFLCIVVFSSGKAQTFTYPYPLCLGQGSTTVLPIPPGAAFPPGGSFTGTGGLFVNPGTGALNLGTAAPGNYTVNYSGSTCNCIYRAAIVIGNTPTVAI